MAYEKECVLFNIAALQSAVAAAQSTESDDGLKLATKLLQQSAGIFAHLRGITPFAIPQEPTPDLNPETLQVLSSLMMAQAQEIFVMKAIKDNMKDGIVAKLACQCEDLYAEALRGLQKDSLRSIFDKEWVAAVRKPFQIFLYLFILFEIRLIFYFTISLGCWQASWFSCYYATLPEYGMSC